MAIKKLLLGTILAASLAGLTGTAHADVAFTPGPSGNVGDINILFEGKEVGNTIFGEVDHSGIDVTFDSKTNQDLDQVAEGQADIFCIQTGSPFADCTNNGGNESVQLNSIEMKPGLDHNTGLQTAWTDVVFNLDFGVGTALITVKDNLGNTFPYVLSKGENKGLLQVVPGSGEVITGVTFTNDVPADAFGFNSFKQPKVSGTCDLDPTGTTCTPVNTPEPASLALLGSGLVGLGYIVRRRRRRV